MPDYPETGESQSPEPMTFYDRSDGDRLAASFHKTRRFTEYLAQNLSPEDCMLQAMADVSPTKWHLAHTAWFFEEAILKPFLSGYKEFDPQFGFLFNSYYEKVGAFFPRPRRGLISRPDFDRVVKYRHYIDEHIQHLFDQNESGPGVDWVELVELGIQHEQQHQELILTDIKYNLSQIPEKPSYCVSQPITSPFQAMTNPVTWLSLEAGLYEIGMDKNSDQFSFDNERPRHQIYLHPIAIADRHVTNGEFLAFIMDDGYQRPEFWLSQGWEQVQVSKWNAPLYWQKKGDQWLEFTLYGLEVLEEHRPVCHVSFFEADAFSRWSGHCLPDEHSWEVLGTCDKGAVERGVFSERETYHPLVESGLNQVRDTRSISGLGNVWDWTLSGYQAYPGYQPYKGMAMEYNGKFMCSQNVLRGGSCLTSRKHYRPTYRNFFYPKDRWQMTGIRLAKEI